MLQLHKILISMVIVGVIMSGIMIFISSGSSYYTMNDYDNETFSGFDQLEALQNQTEGFDSQDKDYVSEDGLLDILGNFFTKMYQSAKIFRGSSDVMTSMADDGLEKLPVGDTFSAMLKSAIAVIFIIIRLCFKICFLSIISSISNLF